METVASQLLLGDRSSQKIAEVVATNIFKALSATETFAGIEGMVLQISCSAFRLRDRKAQMLHVKTMTDAIKSAFNS